MTPDAQGGAASPGPPPNGRPPRDGDPPKAAGLTALEVASGVVTGPEPPPYPFPAADGRSATAAFEDAVLVALRRTPCVVAFSGGRDSSALLAVAASVARREGLGLPVPVTNVFPEAPASEERSWQERVVRHLDLPDWTCLAHTDELDVVGPVATRVLERHGLLFPFNSHFLAPLAEAAAGGSLLTGIGGDELFSWPWPGALARALVARRVRPTRRVAKFMAGAVGPLPVRRAVQRRGIPGFDWLRPEVQREEVGAMADWAARASPRFDVCLRRWYWHSHYLHTCRRSTMAVASDYGTTVVSPFTDPRVFAALARERGGWGFLSRDEAMAHLFGTVLPPDLVTRSDKAEFNAVFFNRHSRELVAAWSGEGVDGALVDLDRLAASWTGESLEARTLLLLQSAWLARRADGRPPDDPSGVRDAGWTATGGSRPRPPPAMTAGTGPEEDPPSRRRGRCR